MISIIITSHITNDFRSKAMRTSMDSLIATTRNAPCEIIVVDNGGTYEKDSTFLNLLCSEGMIHTYIRNSSNLHFGYARNQGIVLANGQYIVIADNDIFYTEGWLEACLKPLQLYPDHKIYSTPLEYPTGMMKERYDRGKLDVEGVEYNLNMRAGSNCMMLRRFDLDKIGHFAHHRIAGTKWTDRAVGMGYLAAVVPGKKVLDLGLRNGYNLGEAIPIKQTLTNGEVIYYNEDEYKRED
jgi:glycosyltransferase involved in cell wall biosynthesis